jgi:hypothetical protein
MYAALYYPHTSLQKPEFAKTALLPWDKMNYISPFRGYLLTAYCSEDEPMGPSVDERLFGGPQT